MDWQVGPSSWAPFLILPAPGGSSLRTGPVETSAMLPQGQMLRRNGGRRATERWRSWWRQRRRRRQQWWQRHTRDCGLKPWMNMCAMLPRQEVGPARRPTQRAKGVQGTGLCSPHKDMVPPWLSKSLQTEQAKQPQNNPAGHLQAGFRLCALPTPIGATCSASLSSNRLSSVTL